MKVRKLVAADLLHVVPMYQQMVEEAKKDSKFVPFPFFTPESPGEFEFALLCLLRNPPPSWTCLVSMIEGRVPKGFLMGEIIQRVFLQPRFSLLGGMLFVEPGFRKKGLAKAMMTEFAAWGRSHGVGSFEVSYVPGTEQHKLWARAGFKTYQATGVLLQNGKPSLEVPKLEVSDGIGK